MRTKGLPGSVRQEEPRHPLAGPPSLIRAQPVSCLCLLCACRAEPVSQQQSPGVQQQQQQQGPGIQQQAPNGLSGMESLNPLSRQVQGQAQAQQQQGSGIYGSVPHQQTPGNQGMSGFGPTLQQGVPQGMQQGVQQGMQPGWQQMGPNGIGSSGRKHFPELASLRYVFSHAFTLTAWHCGMQGFHRRWVTSLIKGVCPPVPVLLLICLVRCAPSAMYHMPCAKCLLPCAFRLVTFVVQR